jgi:membrane-associated phospholipid phosphatase
VLRLPLGAGEVVYEVVEDLRACRDRGRCCHRAAARLWPALLAVWPLVAVVAWSRVQVGDHTPAQVLAIVALGGVVNATVFPLLQ